MAVISTEKESQPRANKRQRVTKPPTKKGSEPINGRPNVVNLPDEIRRRIIHAISAQCTSHERCNFLSMSREVNNRYWPILQSDDALFRRYTMLRHYCTWGLTEGLERYLKHTPLSALGPRGKPGLYPLAMAVRYGRRDCVQLLVRHGACITGYVCLACLFRRCRQGSILGGGFDLPESCPSQHRYHNYPPIECAQRKGLDGIEKYLLEVAAERVGPGPADGPFLSPADSNSEMGVTFNHLMALLPSLPYIQCQRAIIYLFGYSVPRDSYPQMHIWDG